MESCAGLRSCAILDSAGAVVAESAPNDWAAGAIEIWSSVADESRPEPTQVHVANEDGEVYAVRGPAGSAIAVTDRFTLASLMFCDLRSALRGLEERPS